MHVFVTFLNIQKTQLNLNLTQKELSKLDLPLSEINSVESEHKSGDLDSIAINNTQYFSEQTLKSSSNFSRDRTRPKGSARLVRLS